MSEERSRSFPSYEKSLGKTLSLKPSRTLPENVHWNEIATLTRLALIASNHLKQVAFDQLCVPDICHVVTLVAGIGQTLVRKSVYGIVMNFPQSLFLARAEDASGPDLRALVDELITIETLQLFGLARQLSTSEYCDPPSDKVMIDSQEALIQFLVRVVEVTTGSKDKLSGYTCINRIHRHLRGLECLASKVDELGYINGFST